MRKKRNFLKWAVIAIATLFSGQLLAQNVSGDFNVSSDWGSGYCAEITLTNNGNSAIVNWIFNFDLEAGITSFWNVGSWSGNQTQGYTSTNTSWNGTINSGGSVTLGFCANYSGTVTPPSNAFLDGIPVDFGGGGGTQEPPSVSITAPSNGTAVQINEVVTLQADASDLDGNIVSVIFNVDNQDITATNTQGDNWQADWTAGSTPGNFTISATATDNDDLTTNTNIQIIVEDTSGIGGGGGVGIALDLSNLPLQVNFNDGDTITYVFEQNITNVLSRNLSVADIVVSGNAVTLYGLNPGRTGLRIMSGGQDYFMGLRINNSDGTLPGMPDYLSVGSVSEDSYGDLNFWKDVNIGQQNKSMDIRYIYINGGPLTGWQSWGPNRPESYATESLRFGLIPFFVYYNIPDGGESYYTNTLHINDVDYMTAYFNDLNNFLNKTESVMQGELYGIILEPDFLGYIQQNGNPSDPNVVVTCVAANTIAPQAGTVRSLVERINNTIDNKRAAGHNLYYGWQLNLWSYPITGAPQGVIRITDSQGFDAGRATIHTAAEQTTLYGIQAGVLTSNADFLSIDKYGLDAMGHQNTIDPANSTWFFNNDHWMNYLYYVETMHNTSGYPIILWQLPVGHINNSHAVSSYTGNTFTPLSNTTAKYEDSSTPFFLGDTYTAETSVRLSYFTENLYADAALQQNGNDITWGSHMQQVKDAGVISVLFGAGVGISTDGIGTPATDDYFWIQKVQDYYLNGTIDLDWSMFNACSNGCPPNLTITSPTDGEEIVVTELEAIEINITAWDQDGNLTNLSVEIDGQTYQLETTGYTHTLSWMPPDFGTYLITAVATDDDALTSTEYVTFSVVEFDPNNCGIPLWESGTVYSQPGNQVSWDANIYENKWWTLNNQPGLGGWTDPWEFIGPCSSTQSQAMGINENSNSVLSFVVSPNPAKNRVNISLNLQFDASIKIKVFNTMGMQVLEVPVREFTIGKQTIELNTSNLPQGIYSVAVIANNNVETKKLMITD